MATQMPPMEPPEPSSDALIETPTDSDYEYEHNVLGHDEGEDEDEE